MVMAVVELLQLDQLVLALKTIHKTSLELIVIEHLALVLLKVEHYLH